MCHGYLTTMNAEEKKKKEWEKTWAIQKLKKR